MLHLTGNNGKLNLIRKIQSDAEDKTLRIIVGDTYVNDEPGDIHLHMVEDRPEIVMQKIINILKEFTKFSFVIIYTNYYAYEIRGYFSDLMKIEAENNTNILLCYKQ